MLQPGIFCHIPEPLCVVLTLSVPLWELTFSHTNLAEMHTITASKDVESH